ncbi:MAG: phosphate ABC transporter ATP-binding protein PstB [Propionibacteriaceae bacterium]|jgi:phosphate transport system ATP-binding protein|nr:phosphate ABC transporter ATP-binding protein PstB [Propionibacteriaceae bacterium]
MSHLKLDRVSAYYGAFQAVADVSLDIAPCSITALIGPSGCGKSTLLRTLNRLHETTPGARVTGQVHLNGQDVLDPATDPVEVRSRVGMVFQRANPFPTMSIGENVLAGVRLRGRRLSPRVAEQVVERSLRAANLWQETKDRLKKSGVGLSGGQQQRLCIARAIAVQPEVLLMDEPCSALDPASTAAIEELMVDLKADYTVVVVTHNLAQAARVSDQTAFMSVDRAGQPGRLIEHGPTTQLFNAPTEAATGDYIAGKFG